MAKPEVVAVFRNSIDYNGGGADVIKIEKTGKEFHAVIYDGKTDEKLHEYKTNPETGMFTFGTNYAFKHIDKQGHPLTTDGTEDQIDINYSKDYDVWCLTASVSRDSKDGKTLSEYTRLTAGRQDISGNSNQELITNTKFTIRTNGGKDYTQSPKDIVKVIDINAEKS